MRILLASSHQFPASGKIGSGLHPKEYPSGSGYQLHDLLAQGLAEEGHDVFYYLGRGAASLPPPGVNVVTVPPSDFDICHAPIGPLEFVRDIEKFAASHRRPCLLTCHMAGRDEAAANWVFVSNSLARAYGSMRVVMNGVDPNDFIFSAKKEDYLLFIAAMNRAAEKGLDRVLALSKKKGFHLIVAGTGLNYATIERISELCGAAGAEYVGDVRGQRKAELIASARALFFASRLNEGCPLVIIEALVSGTPVISIRGSVEIMTPQTGFLCSSDEEWSDAVDRLDEISPFECRAIALEKFHYRRMTKDYLREYQDEIEAMSSR